MKLVVLEILLIVLIYQANGQEEYKKNGMGKGMLWPMSELVTKACDGLPSTSATSLIDYIHRYMDSRQQKARKRRPKRDVDDVLKLLIRQMAYKDLENIHEKRNQFMDQEADNPEKDSAPLASVERMIRNLHNLHKTHKDINRRNLQGISEESQVNDNAEKSRNVYKSIPDKPKKKQIAMFIIRLLLAEPKRKAELSKLALKPLPDGILDVQSPLKEPQLKGKVHGPHGSGNMEASHEQELAMLQQVVQTLEHLIETGGAVVRLELLCKSWKHSLNKILL